MYGEARRLTERVRGHNFIANTLTISSRPLFYFAKAAGPCDATGDRSGNLLPARRSDASEDANNVKLSLTLPFLPTIASHPPRVSLCAFRPFPPTPLRLAPRWHARQRHHRRRYFLPGLAAVQPPLFLQCEIEGLKREITKQNQQ